jgi:tetratricopeptide (TPR) repeat protein
MASWTGLAHVFHLAGKLETAAECFEKAEEVQRTHQAEQQLHSIWGYRYWELLFDLGKYEEIRERCTTMLAALEKNPTPTWGVGQADFAFAQIALVRANIFLNREDKFDAAQALIEDATRRFSESLNQWAILDALLVKAELALAKRDLTHARAILVEAEHVSVQGKMIASRIGVAVTWARLAIQESQFEEARQRLTEAADLIAKNEKRYQPNPPNWKDWQPPYDDVFKSGDVIGHRRFSKEIEELTASLV